MEKVKATIITKRIKKNLFGSKKYMLGLKFHDIYNIDSESNTKEMRVCFIAYEDLKIVDNVLCPMKYSERGLVFDYSLPIEKIN